MCGGRCERCPPLYLARMPLPTQPVFLKGLTEITMSPTYVYTISDCGRGCVRHARTQPHIRTHAHTITTAHRLFHHRDAQEIERSLVEAGASAQPG